MNKFLKKKKIDKEIQLKEKYETLKERREQASLKNVIYMIKIKIFIILLKLK